MAFRSYTHISPSAFGLWKTDRREFFLKYLALERVPKLPQTEPMSVGSAFDARIKSYLTARFLGGDEKELFDEYFVSQVEEHNRDFALEAGDRVMAAYRDSGALADLLVMMKMMDGEPRFEFLLKGDVEHGGKSVGLLGKPDMFIRVSHAGESYNVLLDWKVNGYCSKSGASPKKGFAKLLCEKGVSRGHGDPHKDAWIDRRRGIAINTAHGMHEIDESWSTQLSIYAWLLGCAVGEKFVCCIDQVACPGETDRHFRIAQHRSIMDSDHQLAVWNSLVKMRHQIDSQWIFDEMTLEDSRAQQKSLSNMGHKGDWIDAVSGRGH